MRDRWLGAAVDWAVRWRYLTFGLTIMMFLCIIALIAGGAVKFRAFPDLDGDVVEARILLPQGTPLEQTQRVVDRLLDGLQVVDETFTPLQPDQQPLVRNVLVQYGSNADAFESGAHLATVTVDLLTAEERDARIDDVFQVWRDSVGTIPDVISLTYKEPQIGPAGLPIDVQLRGNDLEALKSASLALMAWLDQYEGVEDLSDDLRPGKPEVRIRLRDGAMALGVDAATVAEQLRAAYQGMTAAEIQVGTESFEIDVRLASEDRNSYADLDYFVVTLPGGRLVPLTAIAEIETGRGFARVNRIDGRRTVTLRGEVDTRFANVNEILGDTEVRFLPELAQQFPGVDVALKGEAEAQAETAASLQRGFLVGIFGVFLLLSLQFRSYVEPIIVMLAIPFALIGVVLGHLADGARPQHAQRHGFRLPGRDRRQQLHPAGPLRQDARPQRHERQRCRASGRPRPVPADPADHRDHGCRPSADTVRAQSSGTDPDPIGVVAGLRVDGGHGSCPAHASGGLRHSQRFRGCRD